MLSGKDVGFPLKIKSESYDWELFNNNNKTCSGETGDPKEECETHFRDLEIPEMLKY